MKVHSLLLLAIMAAVLLLLIVHQCQAIGSPRHLLKSDLPSGNENLLPIGKKTIRSMDCGKTTLNPCSVDQKDSMSRFFFHFVRWKIPLKLTAAATALAVAIAVPVSVSSVMQSQQQQQALQAFQALGSLLPAGGGFFGTQTPINDMPIPVRGLNLTDDECGDGSVRFRDGNCYPVLGRGPCDNPLHWLTVDPVTLSGQCRPRLCGKGRVFVGSDGLCHDVDDPFECRGGRRLYFSAYGDPICDCPVGQFPFPQPQDDCVALFTQGPCALGQVLTFMQSGALGCSPAAQCLPSSNDPSKRLAPARDGFCYDLGSRGPCSSTQFFAFDVFSLTSRCFDARSSSSPYFTSAKEDAFLSNTFDALYVYDFYRVHLVQQANNKRQDANTAGLFQIPASLPEPLLNPCRPGARNGNNLKCTNPLVSNSRRRNLLQAVRASFACQPGAVLQATGQCGGSERAASCGPSYQLDAITGQCRQVL